MQRHSKGKHAINLPKHVGACVRAFAQNAVRTRTHTHRFFLVLCLCGFLDGCALGVEFLRHRNSLWSALNRVIGSSAKLQKKGA